MTGDMIIYAIQAYEYLQRQVCERGHLERGVVTRTQFPDGERYQRIEGDVSDRDVVVIGGTISDAATLELYDLATGLAKYGAGRLTLVIPYFGYSTMERAVRPGEIVTAKSRAALLSSIPPAARGNRVFLLDLHTEGIAHYFEGAVTTRHVTGRPIIERAARRLGGDDFVLACTDAGRAKIVEYMANELGVDAAFVFKRRLDGSRTEVTAVSAQVVGKRVIIYDDMIRTGGSLIHAASAYADAGASGLAAITSHGLFAGDTLDRLHATGLFSEVVCTNSHPNVLRFADHPLLHIESTAELILNQLRLP